MAKTSLRAQLRTIARQLRASREEAKVQDLPDLHHALTELYLACVALVEYVEARDRLRESVARRVAERGTHGGA